MAGRHHRGPRGGGDIGLLQCAGVRPWIWRRPATGRAREQFSTLDEIFVTQVKKGEIKRAVDVRDALPIICAGPPKNLKRFVEGKISFEEARETAITLEVVILSINAFTALGSGSLMTLSKKTWQTLRSQHVSLGEEEI
jgi:hypothetical protein